VLNFNLEKNETLRYFKSYFKTAVMVST
jgi:hypothetical protein